MEHRRGREEEGPYWLNRFTKYIDRLRHVRRYATHIVTFPQNVMEHQYSVAMLTWVLGQQHLEAFPHFHFNVPVAVQMALCHDVGEAVTGDVLRYIKHRDDLQEPIGRAEGEAIEEISSAGLLGHQMSELWFMQEAMDQTLIPEIWSEGGKSLLREARMVRFCDALDVYLYARMERDHGNPEIWNRIRQPADKYPQWSVNFMPTGEERAWLQTIVTELTK